VLGATVAVVAIAVIVVIIVAMTNSGGSDDNAAGSTGGQSATGQSTTGQSATGQNTGAGLTTASTTSAAPTGSTGADNVVEGDQSRTIDPDKCTEAHNDLLNPNHPDIMTMPDFTSIYVDSVVACIQAAGWSYTTKYVDEQQWGKGTVTSQSPQYLDDYDPSADGSITIWVSTGQGTN
jgi:hypothetical protein